MSCFEELNALDPTAASVAPRIETPTPHKVAVLVLVQQYIKAKKATSDNGLVYSFQSRRNFCMLLLKLIQFPDISYHELYNLLTSERYNIDPFHLGEFEKAMTELCKTLGALFDFAELQNIEKMLTEELGVSQFSLVGVYIRRVGVVLERMTFPEMTALYTNVCHYYEKGCRTLGRKEILAGDVKENNSTVLKPNRPVNNNSKESTFDIDNAQLERYQHNKWSLNQAELFVTQQSNMLENNELRALPPKSLQIKLDEIIKDNPLYSQAYFLCYMNQLRLRDYFGAIEALHRAFDRSPMTMINNFDQKGFQYFSINLAVLHASFNHRVEALNTLRECIMLAQERGDKRCLDLVNTWYCLLNAANVDYYEKSLPDIQDPGLVKTVSHAIQFVVKFGAHHGYYPLDLFELLLKGDELNYKNPMIEHISDALALRSALWCLYGRHEMSSLYSQLLLNLKKTWAFGDVGNSESVCKVLSSLALWLNVQGEHRFSAVVLAHTRERFPRLPNSNNWMISECHMIIQQAIYRFRWQDALKACCQLYLIDRNNGILLLAAVSVARRYFHTARNIIQRLLRSPDLEMLTRVRALVLLAYSTMADDRLSSETVGLLMRASVVASASYLEYECAVVDVILAEVLLRLKMPQKAFQAIKNSMEKININGGIYDRAKADFIFVKCLVAAGQDAPSQKERLLKSMHILERAIKYFKKLEAHAKVLDVFVYMSKSFNTLEDYDKRNIYACKFKHYYTTYPVPREYIGLAL